MFPSRGNPGRDGMGGCIWDGVVFMEFPLNLIGIVQALSQKSLLQEQIPLPHTSLQGYSCLSPCTHVAMPLIREARDRPITSFKKHQNRPVFCP